MIEPQPVASATSIFTTGEPSWRGKGVQPVLVTILFIVAFSFTVPQYIGDTYWYGLDVSDYLNGGGAADHGRLWEFAHVLWRPLAYLLYKIFGGIIASWRGPDVTSNVIWIMMAISALSGWLCCLILNRILAKICGVGLGLLLTASFLCTNAVLNYVHSGASYIPGLVFLFGSCWITQKAVSSPRPRYGWAIGLSLAGASLFWIPYLFGVPVVLGLAFVWDRRNWNLGSAESRERIRLISHAAVVFLAAMIVVYAMVIWGEGIRSPDQLRAWVARSQNGYAQTDTWKRAIPGIARAFVNIGDAGTKLKQYSVRDPYAQVRISDLLTGGLLGMVLFYAGFALLIVELWGRPENRPTLWIFLGSWALIMILAIVVFEPGSAERYLPVYPITYIGLAQAFRCGVFSSSKRVALAAMAGPLLLGMNLFALSSTRATGEYSTALARQTQLDQAAGDNTIATLMEADPLNVLPQVHPLDLRLRPEHFRVRSAVAAGTTQVKTWQRDFGDTALESWRNGSEVWISKRLRAATPKPEWRWVEGENGALWWKDIRTYFGSFETDRETPGEDGFLRVPHSAVNQGLVSIGTLGH
jgi:hypothetical protein